MAEEAHWRPRCVSEPLIRACISELLLSVEFVSPGSFFWSLFAKKIWIGAAVSSHGYWKNHQINITGAL